MRTCRAHKLLTLMLLASASVVLRAQDQDSEVKLISARSAQLIEKDGESFRKVVGPARFYHNKTYLLCDTALWNVNTNIIDAIGHVRIIQGQTTLSSATLQYTVDENMARFRGNLVQLEDKDNNTLRTHYLDYNTKDSVAVFQDGAAMRDKDGQIIESTFGTYDSKARLFTFNDQVNMYMDTTFIKTSRLEYRSDISTAYFGFSTDMWQDDKMLSANDGWYDRSRELFMFRRQVHLLTDEQETWSDSLYYWRGSNDVEMLGNVELMDTTRNVYALAGRFEYVDSLDRVRMTREPAIMSVEKRKGRLDTLYVGADVLLYRGIRKCDIPEGWSAASQKRLTDIAGDPVMEYRRKAAEAAAAAAAEAAKNDPNRPPDLPGKAAGKLSGEAAKPQEGAPKPSEEAPKPQETAPKPPEEAAPVLPDTTAGAVADSLSALMPSDSVATAEPEVAEPVVVEPPKDTTKVAFLWGSKRVRLFRRDIQMSSDSLSYTGLDSLVRLYQDPIFYNEGNRQYAADSIYMVIHNQEMEKAHLLSNAFITIQEDSISFDQIRGAEMVAYFDSTTALTRFDALGGASSLFYLVEKEALATVNKVDAKMIYATFKDGDIERMYYYENPKNDGYPTVQLPQEEKTLKGFRWEPERRPASPLDVTSLTPRRSQRTHYLARPHATFKQTNIYFPGYIKKVYRDIAVRDSLQVVRERQQRRQRDSLDMAEALALADTTALVETPEVQKDTTAAPLDSLAARTDSLAVKDSLATGADSVKVEEPKVLTEAELKAQEKARQKAEKEKLKAEKQAALEAKWAEKDRIYEEKKAAKAQKKLEKERARKLKALRKLEKRAQKERARFEKYLKKEQEKALRKKQ